MTIALRMVNRANDLEKGPSRAPNSKQVRYIKNLGKDCKMDNVTKAIKKVFKNWTKSYLECMRIYGEALLRGGSYGCA